MKSKRFFLWMALFFVFLFLTGFVSAVDMSCSSCAECSEYLGYQDVDNVFLTADISTSLSVCIFLGGDIGSNKMFSCAGHKIVGGGSGTGVLFSDVTGSVLRDCNITGFGEAVVADSSTDLEILNNTVWYNVDHGMRLSSSHRCFITRNSEAYSFEGIFMESDSGNNTLTNNGLCANIEADIRNNGGDNNGGDNRCNYSVHWADEGQADGCSSECTLCPDYDGDKVCDSVDNCKFEPNDNQSDSDGDGTGDACDNCVDLSNPDQDDFDYDGRGDVCDNCREDDNYYQTDADGDCAAFKQPYSNDPHCGDACDKCKNLFNPNQEDSDNDHRGDICDNCRKLPNPYQEDTDNDCSFFNLPYLNDPHCGDLCDNCWNRTNIDQADRDSDHVGDACDCDDGWTGPNENGADCGGVCTKACPANCVPLVDNGDSIGKIDVVFMMAQDYNNDWSRFRTDALNVINRSYYGNPEIFLNRSKINFWYTTKIASFDPSTSSIACNRTAASDWSKDCPQGSIGAILHLANCRDWSQGGVFSAENTSYGTFLHESGHGVFALADEYDDAPTCLTNYFRPTPFPNIFNSQADCQANTVYPPANCVQHTACQGGWWTATPAPSMMGCSCTNYPNAICAWGNDAVRQVAKIFENYTVGSAGGGELEKAIIGYFEYNGTNLEMYDSDIVYGDVPERVLEWQGGLRIVSFNSDNVVAVNFTIQDPRYRDYDYPPGGELMDEATFSVVLPFTDKIGKVVIYNTETGNELATEDIVPTAKDFCADHQTDPQCAPYIVLPNATVYGHVLLGQQFVPNASVTVTCSANGKVVSGNADSKGYYSVKISCPHNSQVTVSARSTATKVCIGSRCRTLQPAAGSATGTISSAGYAVINVPETTT